MNSSQVPRDAAGTLLLRLFIALAFLPAAGLAADEAAPARPAPHANPRIQIQGGGQFQLQLDGGQIQLNGARIRVNAAVVMDAVAGKRLGQPPILFFPSFPFHPLPNLAPALEGKPGYLGVQLETTPAEQGEAADPKEKDEAKKNQGVGILGVVDDSPAAEAGVKEGDRVLAIEGKAVKDSTQLRGIIRDAKAEKTVKLTVRRDGKEIELKAKLAAFPEEDAAMQLPGQNGAAAVPGTVVFNRMIIRSSTSMTSAGSKAAAGDLDVVTLRDGNRFVGRIQRIDPVKGLILRRESGPNMELTEDGISSLTFADREKTAVPPAKVTLQLRDGSSFGGEALTMDRGKIFLTLPGGQRLEFPREHALSATFSDGQAPQIYEGPMSLAGWVPARSGQGNWDYKDGFLRCINNGPIGRNFERMPDPLDLSFDVVYPAQLHHFGVTLFSNAVSQTTAGTLTIQFSPNQISGSHYDGQRYNQYNINLQPADAPESGESKSQHYRLLVDRVNGRTLIHVNGVKRADWTISKVKPEEIGKCGATFSISPNVFTSNNAFQVGRIHILPWDGKEPAEGAEPATPKGDQVLRLHGPPMEGPIERITEREIVFRDHAQSATRGETLHVRFAAPSTPPAELPAAVALLRLKSGSEFTTTQIKGNGVNMTLTTRCGSQIVLPLAALRDLEFLPRPGQPDPSATGADVLTLSDGTQFKGTLITPISGGTLRWKIAASRTPLEFVESGIAGVYFSPGKESPKASALRGSGAVRLGNGDWLPGDIASLDGDRLLLRNDLAPELSFPLATIRSVFLNPDVTATVADGATGPDLWSNGWNPNRMNTSRQKSEAVSKLEEPWAYHDGTYTLKSASRIGSALLGRKWSAYAGAYALNFEVENPGRSASINLQLFNSKEERTFTVYSFGGRVNVYFNPGSSRLNRFVGGAKRFQVDGQAKSEGKTLRMSLVFDRPARTFRVIMDGREIGKIPFKPEEAAVALDVGGVTLIPMASGATGGRQSRIANIWLAPWAGPLATVAEPPERQQRDEPAPEPKDDSASLPTIYLANGDEFTGKIEGITADLLTVNSEAGLLALPRERVAWLQFPGAATAPSDHFPRVRFHDRGVLSVKDLRIENAHVKCQTLDGQTLEFPLSVVKEVVYRPLP